MVIDVQPYIDKLNEARYRIYQKIDNRIAVINLLSGIDYLKELMDKKKDATLFGCQIFESPMLPYNTIVFKCGNKLYVCSDFVLPDKPFKIIELPEFKPEPMRMPDIDFAPRPPFGFSTYQPNIVW